MHGNQVQCKDKLAHSVPPLCLSRAVQGKLGCLDFHSTMRLLLEAHVVDPFYALLVARIVASVGDHVVFRSASQMGELVVVLRASLTLSAGQQDVLSTTKAAIKVLQAMGAREPPM